MGAFERCWIKKTSLFREVAHLDWALTGRMTSTIETSRHNGNTITNPKKHSQHYHTLQFVMQIQFSALMLEFLSKTDQCHIFICMRDAISTASTPRTHLPRTTPNPAHHTGLPVITAEPSLSHRRIFRQLFHWGTELWGRQKKKTAACPMYTSGCVVSWQTMKSLQGTNLGMSSASCWCCKH